MKLGTKIELAVLVLTLAVHLTKMVRERRQTAHATEPVRAKVGKPIVIK